jgi:hypothetical protein
VFLLPYLEQDNLYRQLFAADPRFVNPNDNAINLGGWWNQPTYWQAAQTKIKTFLCPSDNPESSQSGVLTFLYADANSLLLATGYLPSPQGDALGRANYASCAGTIGAGSNAFYGQYAGFFTDRSQNKLVQVTDGTANTIFFGESLGGASKGPRDYSLAWMGAGCFPTAWGLAEAAPWYSYSSKHAGVVQFAFGDGSVRSLRKGVATTYRSADWYAYQAAAGMTDQQVVDWSLIAN